MRARRAGLDTALLTAGLFVCHLQVDLAIAAHARAPINGDLAIYETARNLSTPPQGKEPILQYGWKVVARDSNGNATHARLRLLVQNSKMAGRIVVIGPFNDWGKSARATDALQPVRGHEHIFEAVIQGMKHGTPYRLLLNGKQVLDPTALMYSTSEYMERVRDVMKIAEFVDADELNSLFWDHRHPRLYQARTRWLDVMSQPALISEVELQSLVAKYSNERFSRFAYRFERRFERRSARRFERLSGLSTEISGDHHLAGSPRKKVGPFRAADTYRFVAESGVIQDLKNAGYNVVEMLPFNQSIDGPQWQFRYQVYGLHAPDSRYGNPADFKKMIDAFHSNGLAVVMDFISSHFPFRGNDGPRSLEGLSWDQWIRGDGRPLFAGAKSPWGTYRYDYSNPRVRRYLIESALFMLREFNIDGVRLDNVDGMLGTPAGGVFVRELAAAIHEMNPRALLLGEAFSTPQTLMHRLDHRGYAVNARTDSTMFEYWRRSLQEPPSHAETDAIDKWMANIWQTREMPMMRYLSTHDEAANPRGGLTGAYLASLLGNDVDLVLRKIKMADGFNILAGAYHLAFLQSRTMQKGNFNDDPAIDWRMIRGGSGQMLWTYFSALNRYVLAHAPFFNFKSLHGEINNHTDLENKVMSIHRRDPQAGRSIYGVVNMGDRELRNYGFGVDERGTYSLGFDSDRREYGGKGQVDPHLQVKTTESGQHGRPFALRVPLIPPYTILLFEP